jgi:hypothetical protein
VYYQFGDTFCKNLEDEFVGLVSNTIAVLTTTKGPLYSKYEDVAPNGLVDQFIPFNLQDLKFNGEHEAEKKRIAIWSFGGIVEVSPGSGVLWYERGEVVSILLGPPCEVLPANLSIARRGVVLPPRHRHCSRPN